MVKVVRVGDQIHDVEYLGAESFSTCLKARAHLKKQKWVSFVGLGHSMHPMIEDKTRMLVRPIEDADELSPGMAVFCKVGGGYAVHKVRAVRGENQRFVLIGNNHGGIDGWTSRKHVFGVYVGPITEKEAE